MNKYLSVIGSVLTALYLFALFFLIRGRIDTIWGMELNELGDFFAGAFGPLAILWLILGFFQQGIELRQNTSALELQAEELKNSVEQQKELVNVSNKQFNTTLETLNYERELQRKNQLPIFIVTSNNHSIIDRKITGQISIINIGQIAKNVEIIISSEITPTKKPYWNHDERLDLRIEFVRDNSCILIISYIDSLEEHGKNEFKIVFDSSSFPASFKIEEMQNS